MVGTDRGFIDCAEPDLKDHAITMRFDTDGASYGGLDVIKMGLTSMSEDGVEYEQQLESSDSAQTDDWLHVALVWSSNDIIRFYMNGVEDSPTGTTEPNNPGGTISGCRKLIIGKGGQDVSATSGWMGLIDDVRIYNIALDAEGITQIMRGEAELAWNPSPTNGSIPDLQHVLPLSWSPGDNATEHAVRNA